MRENTTDSVQNRFTAYLVTAVTNKRAKYMAHKNKIQEAEYVHMDLLEKNYTGFEAQFQAYINEEAAVNYEDWEKLQEMLSMIESDKLLKAIRKLKDRVIILADLVQASCNSRTAVPVLSGR
ncbi:MAG TPA: hypothetical protein VJZ04_02490 [Lachnospiraceae bacterium]|nr:hypothetical protein [Lachnospiraceae bacterium]